MLVKLSRFFLFLAPLAIILVNPATLFPFIVTKYVFFRTVVDLSLIFFIWAWATNKVKINWKDFKKPLAIGVIVWVGIFLLSSIFAYDSWAAFWGNFERGESGVQLLHLFIFFFLCTVLLKNSFDWLKMLNIILVAVFLVILYGLLINIVPGLVGPAFSFQNRFQGSLGNPDYIGQVMMFTMFFALYLSLASLEPKEKIMYILWAFLFLFFFVLSQTRGAFLGFVSGLGLFLLYLVFKSPSKKGKLISSILLIVAVLGVTTLIVFRHSPIVSKIPIVNRFADISLQSGAARIWTWGSAVKGIEARPIFGWGPENFSVVFDKYFDPRHFNPISGGETWFDRAHSIIFDYAAETGLVGLAAYLGMFVLYYVQLIKWVKQHKKSAFDEHKHHNSYNQIFLQALFFVMPVVYIITGITLFDVLPMYIMLFVFLAFSNYKLNNG
ncbi:MAG: O-antigen ligase family protein [Minisyncoccia bacterium]